jgi:hypothetical protein
VENDSHSVERIPWHPAFVEALQMDLREYKELLTFLPEFQLTKEPLRIDLVLIKKPKDLIIEKDIARIFKSDNLLEFKSPEDYLSVEEFYKVYAYACLYVSSPEIKAAITDLTLTFITARHPQSLIKHLREVRQYTVEEIQPGIHRVLGDILPIQILESKRLSESENLWLKGLNNDLDLPAAAVILKESLKVTQYASVKAYLNAILQANTQIVQEVLAMSDVAVTLEKALTDAGLLPKWLAVGREEGWQEGREEGWQEGKKEVAKRALAKGISPEDVSDITGLAIETIREL